MAATVPDWLTNVLKGVNNTTASILAAAAGIDPATVGAASASGGTPAPSSAAPASDATPPGMDPKIAATLHALASLPQKKQDQLRALNDSLQTFGQTRDHAPAQGGRLAAAAQHFGGQVLGYGDRPDAAPGGGGRFATILKDHELFHVYGDPKRNMKIDDGQIARDLGIKPKQGGLSVEHPAGDAGHPSNHGRTPVTPNGTGGVMAPSATAAPVDPTTGGTAAPRLAPDRLRFLLGLR